MRCTLHGYYRSSASYRVRIALNLKGVAYDRVGVHLVRDGGAHRSPEYRALNPQMRVPTLVVEEEDAGEVLIQSPAIIEWLDERVPTPPLLPADAYARAHCRAVAAIVGCDIQPLVNIGPLGVLRERFGADDAAIADWYAKWVRDGFAAIETMIDGSLRPFAFGTAPTVADIYLVPQIYNARRMRVPLDDFPNILAVERACADIPAFAEAHPDRQPDAG